MCINVLFELSLAAAVCGESGGMSTASDVHTYVYFNCEISVIDVDVFICVAAIFELSLVAVGAGVSGGISGTQSAHTSISRAASAVSRAASTFSRATSIERLE